MARRLASVAQARGRNNRRELCQREGKILVDDDVVELRCMGDFAAGGQQSAIDYLGRILAALMQALSKRIDRWREDENPDGMSKGEFYLPRTLPVDLQQDVMAFPHALFYPQTRSRVEVAMYLGTLDEFAARAPGLEVRDRDKVLLAPVLVSGACRAGGVGNRQGDVTFLCQQRVDESRLAGAGWCDNQEDVARKGFGGLGPVRHRFTPGSGSARASARSAASIRPPPASFRWQWPWSLACWLPD